ncbi:hypothetical protein A9Q84_16710 [Halobacteriovorax marinus]|uniref:Urea ABC transporter substrate-binding protein n=1 Tax=Halobacteriovorax marinus TaxID=97084 RepID=A0A1Y5F4T6_9BACT|nr:hypothetical protein A9Q84_16710 [Halobacteriovorax marinus]
MNWTYGAYSFHFLLIIITFQARSAEPIKVGILHSLSGTMAISESPVVISTLLAIDEINEKGGLLGRKIKVVIRDGSSNLNHFKKQAESLILDEEVSAVFGCWTSASRKSVKIIFEKYNNLLFYPVQYEGLEQSKNIVYMGATPNQQILPALEWAKRNLNIKKILLVGSDYIFPRLANTLLKHKAKEMGINITDEVYIPLGSNDISKINESIKNNKPDMIFNTINGDSNIALFETIKNTAFSSEELPIISFSIAETEIQEMNIQDTKGHYASWNYFQSLNTKENIMFLNRLKIKAGIKIASDPMVSAYQGVHLWARAVKRGASPNPEIVRMNLNETFMGPSGPVKMNVENNHIYKRVYIGKINSLKQFDIIWKSKKMIKPLSFPLSKKKREWEKVLTTYYKLWNYNWALIPQNKKSKNSKTLRLLIPEETPYMTHILKEYKDFGILGNFLKNIFAEQDIEVKFEKTPKVRLGMLYEADQVSFPLSSSTKYLSDIIWKRSVGIGYKKKIDFDQIKTIGVIIGEEIPKKIRNLIATKNIKIKYSSKNKYNVKKLMLDRVDAVVIDEAQLYYFSSLLPFSIFDITFDEKYKVEIDMKVNFQNKKERDQFNFYLQKYRHKNVINLPRPPWRR